MLLVDIPSISWNPVIVQGVVRHSQSYRFQLLIPLSLVTDIICVKAACCFEQLFCMSSFAQLSISERVAEEMRSKVTELKDFQFNIRVTTKFRMDAQFSNALDQAPRHGRSVEKLYVPQRRSVERCIRTCPHKTV